MMEGGALGACREHGAEAAGAGPGASQSQGREARCDGNAVSEWALGRGFIHSHVFPARTQGHTPVLGTGDREVSHADQILAHGQPSFQCNPWWDRRGRQLGLLGHNRSLDILLSDCDSHIFWPMLYTLSTPEAITAHGQMEACCESEKVYMAILKKLPSRAKGCLAESQALQLNDKGCRFHRNLCSGGRSDLSSLSELGILCIWVCFPHLQWLRQQHYQDLRSVCYTQIVSHMSLHEIKELFER